MARQMKLGLSMRGITISFAHGAYRLGELFVARNTGGRAIDLRSLEIRRLP